MEMVNPKLGVNDDDECLSQPIYSGPRLRLTLLHLLHYHLGHHDCFGEYLSFNCSINLMHFRLEIDLFQNWFQLGSSCSSLSLTYTLFRFKTTVLVLLSSSHHNDHQSIDRVGRIGGAQTDVLATTLHQLSRGGCQPAAMCTP